MENIFECTYGVDICGTELCCNAVTLFYQWKNRYVAIYDISFLPSWTIDIRSVFTHVLGHADWGHYIGNMAYLLLLGPILEEKYGSLRVFQVIAITAVVTGVLNYVLFPNVALCGASGVCFAFILWAAYTGFRQREIPLTFILVAAIFIGQQIYEGVTIQNNISNMSHIVGGIVGSVAGFALNRKRGKR